MSVYYGYLTGQERVNAIEEAKRENQWNKLITLYEMTELQLLQMERDAEVKVFEESGTYDDLIYLYQEAKEEVLERKKSLFRKLIDWISNLFKSIGEKLSGVKGKGKPDDEIDYTKELDENIGIIKKSMNNLNTGFAKLKNMDLSGALDIFKVISIPAGLGAGVGVTGHIIKKKRSEAEQDLDTMRETSEKITDGISILDRVLEFVTGGNKSKNSDNNDNKEANQTKDNNSDSANDNQNDKINNNPSEKSSNPSSEGNSSSNSDSGSSEDENFFQKILRTLKDFGKWVGNIVSSIKDKLTGKENNNEEKSDDKKDRSETHDNSDDKNDDEDSSDNNDSDNDDKSENDKKEEPEERSDDSNSKSESQKRGGSVKSDKKGNSWSIDSETGDILRVQMKDANSPIEDPDKFPPIPSEIQKEINAIIKSKNGNTQESNPRLQIKVKGTTYFFKKGTGELIRIVNNKGHIINNKSKFPQAKDLPQDVVDRMNEIKNSNNGEVKESSLINGIIMSDPIIMEYFDKLYPDGYIIEYTEDEIILTESPSIISTAASIFGIDYAQEVGESSITNNNFDEDVQSLLDEFAGL